MKIVPGKKEQRRLDRNEKSIRKWTGIDVRFLVLILLIITFLWVLGAMGE